MQEKQMSNGKLAYKLYNKVGATEQEKARAKEIIDAEKPENLDIYGKFVRSELIFWDKSSCAYTYIQAIEVFQQIITDKQMPKTLVVGACFYLGRMYELGLGVDYDMNMAYAHYRLANKLNPKACIKDIARLEKILSSEPKQFSKDTPNRYAYRSIYEHDKTWEYNAYLRDCAEDYRKCQESLKRNRFFYPDDTDKKKSDDVRLYCIDGVEYFDVAEEPDDDIFEYEFMDDDDVIDPLFLFYNDD